MSKYGKSPIYEALKNLPSLSWFACNNTKRFIHNCKPYKKVESKKIAHWIDISHIDITDMPIISPIDIESIYKMFQIPKEYLQNNNINMSFKKNPTVEELQNEVDLLRKQLVNANAAYNAKNKQYLNIESIEYLKRQPLEQELSLLKSKWWVKVFYKG